MRFFGVAQKLKFVSPWTMTKMVSTYHRHQAVHVQASVLDERFAYKSLSN